jgi:hypothetical protein
LSADPFNNRHEAKLTNNFTSTLLEQSQPPDTVEEAVGRLSLILDSGQKAYIASMKEEDLIDLHFGLGLAIRNAYGLHQLGSKLLASCGASLHPDDASGVIINKLWQTLQQQE